MSNGIKQLTNMIILVALTSYLMKVNTFNHFEINVLGILVYIGLNLQDISSYLFDIKNKINTK